MRRCLPLVLGLLAALALVSCVETEDPGSPDLTVAEAGGGPCLGCAIPPVTNWTSRLPPSSYVPSGVRHMQTMLTQGDSDRIFFAWGIGDGKVRYIHRALKTDFNAYLDDLAQGWMTMTSPTAKLTYGIGGSISSPPPRHPPQPGQPWFSQGYADEMVSTAFDIQTSIEINQGNLPGMP
jgi:hypothetical protein